MSAFGGKADIAVYRILTAPITWILYYATDEKRLIISLVLRRETSRANGPIAFPVCNQCAYADPE
jgi:hypothetical protein